MTWVYDFIGVGGLAYDLALTVDQLPLTDDKFAAEFIGQLPGGFIANATCAAARLGLRTTYAGWVGADAPGELLYQDFVRRGVEPNGLRRVTDTPTPFTVVITDRAGQRCILVPANPLFQAELDADQIALAAEARIVYTFPRDPAWVTALHSATQRSGGQLALDIEAVDVGAKSDLVHAIQHAGIVFVSRRSLTLLGADSLQTLAAPERWVILTDGARGAYGITGGMAEPVFCPALPVENVVDTTGAGDTFHAALIAAYLDGAELPAALAFASAAAALKIQQHGARNGLPTRAAVAAKLNAQS